MKIVNKNELISAHQSKQLLAPAIEALKAINVQSVGHDPYSLKKVTEFVAWLQKFEAKANSVLSQAQLQHDNRPVALINAAAIRFNTIPEKIELEQKTSQGKIEAHITKTEELKKKGFSSAEIDNILPLPKDELNTHERTIASLKTEQHNLGLFLGDAPRYNTALLDMEKLSPYLQHHNSAD